jgi:hypothetical protein
MTEEKKEIKLKEIFGDKRIVALVGEKNQGKTNNLTYLIKQYRESRKDIPIFIYGFPSDIVHYLKKYNVQEISSMKHLVQKRDCILILDQVERLKLNDRRYKEELDLFVDFVYHSNVYVILCSPNVREFNSILGGVIERWLLKTVREDSCVNGSQLKVIIDEYKGKYKSLGAIEVPKNEMLLINNEQEIIVSCDYVKEADTKEINKNLF